jgi:hypothetical protein
MKFCTRVYLPILNKHIKIEPITNRYFFNLVKFITNNDDDSICEYFEFIIQNVILDKNLLNELSNIEKFIILLNAKSLSSGNKLQLVGSNQVKTDILISSILKNIVEKIENIKFNHIINTEGIEIGISLPKNLKLKNLDDIYKEVINYIKIEDDFILFSSLTQKEKEDIINQIPVSITGDILNYILKIQEDFNKIHIISGNERMGLDTIPLNVFDNTLYYFLKSLFNDNLKNFYELQYVLINKIFMSYDHFLEITPNDCKVFINLYNEDIKKQQEQQKNTQGGAPSLPSMPSMPKFK